MTSLTEPRKELQAPPPLILPPPLCPMCGEEVTNDGDAGWECLADKASWSGLNIGWKKGEWQEADIYACLSMAKPNPDAIGRADVGWMWQCAKPLGHDGPHYAADGTQWPNSWLVQSDPVVTT